MLLFISILFQCFCHTSAYSVSLFTLLRICFQLSNIYYIILCYIRCVLEYIMVIKSENIIIIYYLN